MVRIELSPEDQGGSGDVNDDPVMASDVFYIGTGGVGGLTSSLLGGHLPGERNPQYISYKCA